jgi:hypothetical protein
MITMHREIRDFMTCFCHTRVSNSAVNSRLDVVKMSDRIETGFGLGCIKPVQTMESIHPHGNINRPEDSADPGAHGGPGY